MAVVLVLIFAVFMVAVVTVLALNASGFALFSLSEHKKVPTRFSDHIPWALMLTPKVVFNKNGSLMMCFRYRGPDLFSSTKNELVAISGRFNNALKRLPAGWALYADDHRVPSAPVVPGVWPEPVSEVIDVERQEFFKNSPHFENQYYLTLVYLPPKDMAGKVAQMFYEGDDKRGKDLQEYQRYFEQECQRISNLVGEVIPEIAALESDDLLTYLHSCVSLRRHRVKTPETPMYLDALLPDTPLTGGLAPRLGKHHLQLLTVREFPGDSVPGLLDALNRLPFEYRWTTRFIFEDRAQASAAMKTYQQRWLSGRKSFMTVVKEALFGEESLMQNSDAVNKAEDCDVALQELGTGLVTYGYFTQTVLLADDDLQALENKKLAVERVINGLGFTTIDENENHNAFDAFLGTVPGNCAHNIRHPLLSSMNLIHLFPLSAVWSGSSGDKNLNGEPLMNVVTEGATPFRLSLNYGDVGHTLIIGPTGSGKSTLLRALESAWLRYPNAQVYTFDKNKSSQILTKAVGGEFYDLGSDDSALSFQPLSEIDQPSEAAWALEWITTLVEHEGQQLTPERKGVIWQAIQSLAKSPKPERTLTALRTLVNDKAMKEVIRVYTHEGTYGKLLDSDRDTLQYGRWQTFEMGALMSNYPKAVMPVLTYLFHKLERRFDASRPTLLPIDEGWLFLDSPVFAPRLREWLKTLRRFKVYLVFASQSPADVANSGLFDVIKESCFTKLFLPNPNALQEGTSAFYQRFALNERQIEIIAGATPKSDYYFNSPYGNRLFSLALGDIGLTYCAATGDADVKAAAPLMKLDTQSFNTQYLADRQFPWVADMMYGAPESSRGAAA